MPSPSKQIPIEPLSGALDLRAPPGAAAFTDFRLVLNMGMNEMKRRCRDSGWKRALADSPFGFLNQDLHDQLTYDQFYYGGPPSYTAFFPGALTGYTYTYLMPGANYPYEVTTKQKTGPFCGYASDFYGVYSWNPEIAEGLYITDPYSGYPYVPCHQAPYDGALGYLGCNSGNPDHCVTSYFFVTDVRRQEFIHHSSPYSYGDFAAAYSFGYSKFIENCDRLYQDTSRCCREPITFLKEFRSSSCLRRLLAGSKSRLWVLNEPAANWRILADRLGGDPTSADCDSCPTTRFRAATLGDYIVLTNNFDPVLYWAVDDGSSGCDLWSAHAIDDLAALAITRARVVAQWKGFVFVGNFEENYRDKPFALVWSDYNDPLAFIPGGESLAGRHEFGQGERILEIAPLGDYLYIYTDQAIHQCLLIGQENEVFRFREIYRGPQMPRYFNSFVNTGEAHLWCGIDGIYTITGYSASPQRVEWIHKASGAIYRGVEAQFVESFPHLAAFGPVDPAACDNLIGFYDEVRQEVVWSWPTRGNTCANMSLKISLRYATATLVDYGWTAGCSYTPDRRPSIRDFFAELGVCEPDEFTIDPKEGTPYTLELEASPPAYLVNQAEDPSQPSHPNSLCTRLANIRLDDICGDCDAPRTLITASASDKTLKEHDPEVFYREEFEEVEPGAIAITTASLPAACRNQAYSQTLQATGGSPWTVTAGSIGNFPPECRTLGKQFALLWEVMTGTLPPGLTLNACSGEIAGVPTVLGDYSVTFAAHDAACRAAMVTLTITVTAC